MRLVAYISALLLSPTVHTAFAIDANGYTAQYECRAGGPYCDVDVARLSKRACDQVIDPSTPWSWITWSNNTICLSAGDHTHKGTLTIPADANGSAGNYKVLRYYSLDDNGADPWKQSNQAKIERLVIEGDFWLIDRLTFPAQSGVRPPRIEYRASGSNDVRDIIINRILIEGGGDGSNYYGISTNGDDSQDYQGLVIQNSVLRNLGPYAPNWEAVGISLHVGHSSRNSRFYIVNNEIYDWVSHPIQIGRNQLPVIPGIVVENNDLYVTPALHRQDGRAASEAPLSIKVSGTASHPIKVIHNRMWGARRTDMGICCTGESGQAITTYNSLSYLLVQNNIIGESQIGSYPTNLSSWIGNIFYSIKRYYDCGQAWCNSHVLQWGGNDSEVYLNTVINNPSDYSFSVGGQSTDIRCNTMISASGREVTSTPPVGTQIDNNTFYDTPKITYNGNDDNIVRSIRTRQNSTYYNVGEIIRTGSPNACAGDNDSDCFLYKVVAAGTSGDSPQYCTTLGCTMSDGKNGLTLRAVRGPYTFHRKLRTSPEAFTIPYARVYARAPGDPANAPEAFACPQEFANREGIGISNPD